MDKYIGLEDMKFFWIGFGELFFIFIYQVDDVVCCQGQFIIDVWVVVFELGEILSIDVEFLKICFYEFEGFCCIVLLGEESDL